MFEGEYKEGHRRTAVLEDIEGVVSVQSLEAFLQWLYLRKIKFKITGPEHQISAMIELARFADMCIVMEMEAQSARQLKKLLLANPYSALHNRPAHPEHSSFICQTLKVEPVLLGC
jgi:hypothetical protein